MLQKVFNCCVAVVSVFSDTRKYCVLLGLGEQSKCSEVLDTTPERPEPEGTGCVVYNSPKCVAVRKQLWETADARGTVRVT